MASGARIFHIVSRSEWQAACEVGRYAPSSLASDGFVHFSLAEQVAPTANRYYRGGPDLLVVEIDPDLLDEPVVFEDLYGMDEAFPHVYGTIPTAAAVRLHELQRLPDGDWAFNAQA